MATLRERIVTLVSSQPSLSDREITDALLGTRHPQQSVNQACRYLAKEGAVVRQARNDGIIGNYAGETVTVKSRPASPNIRAGQEDDGLAEDTIKALLHDHLTAEGWKVVVAWGKSRGVDIEAKRGSERWLIEVKGRGSRPQMRVNYFLSMLGELLQRMDDPKARYSIALPDLPQFRGLWTRLPILAKSRTTITALLVGGDGTITELHRESNPS